MTQYRVANVSYSATYKPIGKHPDGRIFAVRRDGAAGLFVVDRDLNLVSTLNSTLPANLDNCAILSTGTMIAWGTYINSPLPKSIYRSTDAAYSSFSVVQTFSETNLVIERGVAVSTLDDTIMYAEYTTTRPVVWSGDAVDQPPRTNPTIQRVWRGTNDGQTWEVVFTANRNPQFEGDTEIVRHLHGIAYDPYENLFWFFSGDGYTSHPPPVAEDDRYGWENKIWTIKPDGTEVTKIGEGSQIWRITSIAFLPDYVCWGSDSYQTDHAFARLNRQSRTLEPLSVPNDAIRITDKIQIGGSEVLVSNKSYESGVYGNLSNPGTVELFVSSDGAGQEWQSVYEWDANDLNVAALLTGLIDNKDGRIYAHLRNIKDADGSNVSNTTAIIDIEAVPATISTPAITYQNDTYTATVTAQNLPNGSTVTAYLRQSTEQSYTAYPMTPINGTWQAELPLTVGAWHIYAEATDGVDVWQSAEITCVVEPPPIGIVLLPTTIEGTTRRHRVLVSGLQQGTVVFHRAGIGRIKYFPAVFVESTPEGDIYEAVDDVLYRGTPQVRAAVFVQTGGGQ